MKIKWIEFKNLKTGLEIERIEFHNDTTLLVGLSGVGKSQILDAIEYSLKLAVDKDIRLKPYEVNMCILVDKDEYEWSYKIDKLNDESISIFDKEKYYFSFEKLQCNGKIMFERNESDFKVVGYSKILTPKRGESLLLQYSEDDQFTKLISEINKLYTVDLEPIIMGVIGAESFTELKAKVSIIMKKIGPKEFSKFSQLPAVIKLYIAKEYYHDIYNKILESVQDLFNEIEDIDVVEDKEYEAYVVAIKVYGKTILQYDISNGMLKTIYYMVELFTMTGNSIVLIDEFENGLGVNCIDSLTDMLLEERDDLQFIITTHHPKIINRIPVNKWKIIERDKCTVKNINSKEYNIGRSQHDSYFSLINRWEYDGKIK